MACENNQALDGGLVNAGIRVKADAVMLNFQARCLVPKLAIDVLELINRERRLGDIYDGLFVISCRTALPTYSDFGG
jgi:hypothetical protein